MPTFEVGSQGGLGPELGDERGDEAGAPAGPPAGRLAKAVHPAGGAEESDAAVAVLQLGLAQRAHGRRLDVRHGGALKAARRAQAVHVLALHLRGAAALVHREAALRVQEASRRRRSGRAAAHGRG